ncbi:MAG: DNA repair protein RecN [Ignavibacteriales bacterium]|nr:DNA repair protein RecN [Ignavibacteriales bacterium]
MLNELHIKNFAIIEELTIEFERGLNIITGETGAGKSILIDALSLAIGERANSEMIRSGSEKAIVEATFKIANFKLQFANVKSVFKENEIECGDEILLRREVSTKGTSRCFVNDAQVSVSVLKAIGDELVDLHGQHEHQSLLRKEKHREYLDQFANIENELRKYSETFFHARKILNEKKLLEQKESQLKEKLSLFQFQLSEIEKVNPQVGEDELLEKEIRKLQNGEKIYELTTSLYEILYDNENAISVQLKLAQKKLDELLKLDESFSEITKEIISATASVEESANSIQRYRNTLEFDEKKIDEMRIRAGEISLLKKKFGGTLETVLAKRNELEQEISLVENFEKEIQKLSSEFGKARVECEKLANQISDKRISASKKLNKAIESSLKELGIVNGIFETKIFQKEIFNGDELYATIGKKRVALFSNGFDEIEFFVSTNKGEEPKPLIDVASGGEISRIMLSLKSSLAKADTTPVLIFDEIDVGISGRIAQAVGKSLKQLSEHHQVISITHLPQITGFADSHFVVEKIENGKRTATSIRKLSEKERVVEIAKLMSGEKVTDAALKSAKELMNK